MRTCKRCGQTGHNVRTCTNESRAQVADGLIHHTAHTDAAYRYYTHPSDQTCERCERKKK